MTRLVRDIWRLGRSRGALWSNGDVADPSSVFDALWPGAKVRPGRAKAANAITFLALPSPDNPSVLLPLRPSRATAAVLRAHRAPQTTRQRIRHAAMVAMALMGAAHLVPRKVTMLTSPSDREAPIESYLGSIVGCQISVGIHLGPPRANRKPILQLIGDHGKTVAFVKVGINDLTRDLVRAETGALRSLENIDFASLTIPQILHSGSWGDNELLVLGPVNTRNASRSQPLLQQAMVELSTSQGTAREVLVRSDYWTQLRRRIQRLRGAHTAALADAVEAMEARSNDVLVALGAWHGDWTPWNMATREYRVVLWDWERFATGVPVGFDALHFELQSTIRRGRMTPHDAASAVIARAAILLAPFGISCREVPVVTATYLLEIGVRYVHDRQEEAGSRLGDISAWLLPELTALVGLATAEHQA